MPKLKVRSLAADPAYAALLEKRNEFREKLTKLDLEENDLHFRLAHQPVSEAKLTAKVAALLGDELDPTEPEPNGINARLGELHKERQAYRTALAEVESRLMRARYAASKVVCDEVRSAYTTAVRDLAKALRAAEQAHSEYLSIVSALDDEAIAWTVHLPPMQANAVFGHDGSNVEAWLAEAGRSGMLADGAR